MAERKHEYPDAVQVYEDVTRITVVGEDSGRAFERYDLYENGCEIHLQDGGKTLKIFPRITPHGPYKTDHVTLKRGDESLSGRRTWEYPVDEPPVIEAGGFRLYQYIWRQKGWEVIEDGSE